jgi:hypothetical protein
VDAIARGEPGGALVVGPDKVIAHTMLTPAHTDPPWCDLVPRSQLHRGIEPPSLTR